MSEYVEKELGKVTINEIVEECDIHRSCSSCPFFKLTPGKCVLNLGNKNKLSDKVMLTSKR